MELPASKTRAALYPVLQRCSSTGKFAGLAGFSLGMMPRAHAIEEEIRIQAEGIEIQADGGKS